MINYIETLIYPLIYTFMFTSQPSKGGLKMRKVYVALIGAISPPGYPGAVSAADDTGFAPIVGFVTAFY